MINIDGVFYEGSLNKTKVKINEEWMDILVLDINKDLEPIDIIKYQDKIYKIDKVINRFEDNKKWLTYIQESPDLEKKKIEELAKDNKELKKESEKLKQADSLNKMIIVQLDGKMLELEAKINELKEAEKNELTKKN